MLLCPAANGRNHSESAHLPGGECWTVGPSEQEHLHLTLNQVQRLQSCDEMRLFTHVFATDHLFEAAVEVNFSQDVDERWDELARSLLLSVKASVR